MRLGAVLALACTCAVAFAAGSGPASQPEDMSYKLEKVSTPDGARIVAHVKNTTKRTLTNVTARFPNADRNRPRPSVQSLAPGQVWDVIPLFPGDEVEIQGTNTSVCRFTVPQSDSSESPATR